MIERTGDLFESDAKYLAQGVNCRGMMGAGIAHRFAREFPDMRDNYYRLCANGTLTPGSFACEPVTYQGRSRVVLNLASQDRPGANADYSLLFSSLHAFAQRACDPEYLRLYGGIVAIPEIGCGIGGLEWKNVKKILKTIEYIYPEIEFEVWHYV